MSYKTYYNINYNDFQDGDSRFASIHWCVDVLALILVIFFNLLPILLFSMMFVRWSNNTPANTNIFSYLQDIGVNLTGIINFGFFFQ